MVEDIISLIFSIEQKAENMKRTIAALDTERMVLTAGIEEREKEIQLYKQKITDLENKNRILHVTGGLSGSTGSCETFKAKKVLDEMVQEIDRCVTLLNR
jgi:polyhydroxyalkanoate synthesis regulator phasin